MVAMKVFFASSVASMMATALASPAPVAGQKFIRDADAHGKIFAAAAMDISDAQSVITDLQMNFIAQGNKPTAGSIKTLITGVRNEANSVMSNLGPEMKSHTPQYSAAISNVVAGSFYPQVLNSIDMAVQGLDMAHAKNTTDLNELNKAFGDISVTLDAMEQQAVKQNNKALAEQISKTQSKVKMHVTKDISKVKKTRSQTNVFESVVSGVTAAKQNVDTLTNNLIAKGPSLDNLYSTVTGLDSQIDSLIGLVGSSNANAQSMSEESSNALFNPFIESVTKSTDVLLEKLSKGPLDPILASSVKNLESSTNNLANLAGRYNMKASQTNLININHRIHLLFMDHTATPASAAPQTLSPLTTSLSLTTIPIYTTASILNKGAEATDGLVRVPRSVTVSSTFSVLEAEATAQPDSQLRVVARDADYVEEEYNPVSITAPAAASATAPESEDLEEEETHEPESVEEVEGDADDVTADVEDVDSEEAAADVEDAIPDTEDSVETEDSPSAEVSEQDAVDLEEAEDSLIDEKMAMRRSNLNIAAFVRARANRIAKMRARMVAA